MVRGNHILSRLLLPVWLIGAPVLSLAQNTPHIPATNDSELASASSTRIYLTAFQSYVISVVDPKSGHAVHEIEVKSQQAGIAVSPEGRQLYVLDGRDYDEGLLRIFDTASWRVTFEIPVAKRAVLLFGNSLSLSGDGRWLLVQQYGHDSEGTKKSVFDTSQRRFCTDLSLDSLLPNTLRFTRMAGQPGHSRIYIDLEETLQCLRSSDLTTLWTFPTPKVKEPVLLISPDQERLYGLYPEVASGLRCQTPKRVALWMIILESSSGRVLRRMDLTETMSVPGATIGRGDRGYLVLSPGGMTLYVGWENRLWALDSGTLDVENELKLPFAVDGMVSSVDGTELYLLPTTAATTNPTLGLWAVATHSFEMVRHTEDWPRLGGPFMFSAPSPGAER
jgi:hypothetical protein